MPLFAVVRPHEQNGNLLPEVSVETATHKSMDLRSADRWVRTGLGYVFDARQCERGDLSPSPSHERPQPLRAGAFALIDPPEE